MPLIHRNNRIIHFNANWMNRTDIEAFDIGRQPSSQGNWPPYLVNLQRHAIAFFNANPGWVDLDHL